MNGFEIGASTRSPIALFLVPFMCVWSGGSIGGIYGTQIAKGEFSLGQSIFGIPFLLGTCLFGTIALMTVCGKVVVTVDRNNGTIFTGIGPIGWRRRFKWDEVTTIRTAYSPKRQESIALEGGTNRIDFGSGLNTARRHFVLTAIRQMRHGQY